MLRPTIEPIGLAGLVIAAAVACASKYLLVWRGRHIFNPAAVGATVVTIVATVLPLDAGIGSSAWWVGSPILLVPVLVLGIIVAWRTEKLAVVSLFLLVALVVTTIRVGVQYQQAGLELSLGDAAWQMLSASPFVFLATFMLTEPLTTAPRRWQQLVVAGVVGLAAGWPIPVGYLTLGQERALLIGNLVAFILCVRGSLRLSLTDRGWLTPTIQELVFTVDDRLRFEAGQYLELEVPHPHPDSRGTRRPFSIVSAPEDLPTLRIAYRDGAQPRSSFKTALADAERGGLLHATGVWGDFLLPADARRPILLLAGGIGITPFISQLRHLAASGQTRDIVLVYVVSDPAIAFRDEIAATGIATVVFAQQAPDELPAGWTLAPSARIDGESLLAAVPDLSSRDAYVSGPPRLIADLTPSLRGARTLTTDAFAGY